MPNAKKSEIVSFCLLPRGDVISNFVSYSKAVLVDLSMWKISHHGKLICLVFAATVDNFHFSVPFSDVSSAAVCAYNQVLFRPLLPGLPLRNSRETMRNKETHCSLSSLCAK